jgi:ectoine hydroxylase-related dioxygenase (phytanoyl-CoA dioxygenase family)
MSHDLTAKELRAYQRDGFLIRPAVLADGELAEVRDAAERTVAAAAALANTGHGYVLDGNRFVDAESATVQFEHSPDSETVRVIEPAHRFDRRWEALIDDERLVAPMRALVGSDRVALWTDKLNLKRPREGSGFRWHQDSPYWMHDCGHVDQLPNVMVTLDDADADNGCLRIIRGSHRRGLLPGTADGSQLGGFFTDPACFDEADQVLLEAPAGSLVFFSPHAIHGSQPNRSDRPRRAWIVTYQPADFPMLKLPQVRNTPQR